jgi:acyl-CoA thioesterase-1
MEPGNDAASRPTVLFIGDSITDCDRRTDPTGLGNGYVRDLAYSPELSGVEVVNRGISGERARDLRARWEQDVLAEKPTLVSILVGINEVWRRFDSGDATSASDFERVYRELLELSAASRLVLIEPFLLPVNPEQATWRDDLDEKRHVVRALAREFGAALVPADDALTALNDPHGLAPDGFHPSDKGHRELARLWLHAAAPILESLPG